MYAIVRFLASNSVAVVSSNWLLENETKCFWPAKKNSDALARLLKTRAELDDTNSRKFDVKVLRKTASYEEARLKLPKYVHADDGATSTDQEKGRGKRQRIVLKLSSSDESESGSEDFHLPELPVSLQRNATIGTSQARALSSSTPQLHQSALSSATPELHQSALSSSPQLHQCALSTTPHLPRALSSATPELHQSALSSPQLHQCALSTTPQLPRALSSMPQLYQSALSTPQQHQTASSSTPQKHHSALSSTPQLQQSALSALQLHQSASSSTPQMHHGALSSTPQLQQSALSALQLHQSASSSTPQLHHSALSRTPQLHQSALSAEPMFSSEEMPERGSPRHLQHSSQRLTCDLQVPSASASPPGNCQGLSDGTVWPLIKREIKMATRAILKELALVKEQNELLLALLSQRNEDEELEPAERVYPLASVHDVEEVQDNIASSKSARKQLCKVLSLIGGSSVRNVTANIMKYLFQDAVGVHYSLYGQKGKKRLVGTEIYRVIMDFLLTLTDIKLLSLCAAAPIILCPK